jgi:hypothetical protein
LDGEGDTVSPLSGDDTAWKLSGVGKVEGVALSGDGDIGDGDDDGSFSGEGVPLGVDDPEDAGDGVADVG